MGDTAIRSKTLVSLCGAILSEVSALWLSLPLTPDDAPDQLRQYMGNPQDWQTDPVCDGAHLVYLNSIVDKHRLADAQRAVWTALTQPHSDAGTRPSIGMGTPVLTNDEAIRAILAGRTLLVMQGACVAIAMDLASWPTRETSEPNAELVIQGPHDGFVETLSTNIALVRRRIPEPTLRCERIDVGDRSRVQGALFYQAGMVRPQLLARIRRHLRGSRPSYVMDSTMLAQWLTFRSGVLVPTLGKTERPDTAAAAILGGRVVIFVDGSPVALIVPAVLSDVMHSPDDYYNRPVMTFLRRVMRLIGLAVAICSSPLFVALVTINRELVPTQLFVSIAQARRGVPLGAVPEILVLELAVEIIREAGLHLPGSLGQTISVVGAVVIGQSAVIAGLISAPAIVVVSVAFIASFTVPSPDLTLSLRVLRYPLILLAAAFGIFGIAWGITLLLIYLCSIDSFGVPYLTPYTPLRPRGLQDAIWRTPLPWQRRPFVARPRRQGA